MDENFSHKLLFDVHDDLQLPALCTTEDTAVIKGKYAYYHYGIDGTNDTNIMYPKNCYYVLKVLKGWGCGYRTLQTICSWIIFSQNLNERYVYTVPSIEEIQHVLIKTGDKERHFLGSKEWIGSYEVFLVLDSLFKVSCKLVHIPKGSELVNFKDVILNHFEKGGSPLMMGGDRDAASKGIVGICTSKINAKTYLLVLDPHCPTPVVDHRQLQKDGWVTWKDISEFCHDSFYNICLPNF